MRDQFKNWVALGKRGEQVVLVAAPVRAWRSAVSIGEPPSYDGGYEGGVCGEGAPSSRAREGVGSVVSIGRNHRLTTAKERE